ncbi:MAG: DMT family transporter [Bacteroidetes bacterium]|nr:DMT family transporter [Bacteroidota bacterium]
MNKKTQAHLAVLGANIIFAANYSIVKFITPTFIHPFALNFVRVASSIILFWFLWLLKPGPIGIQRKHIPRFIACGITGVLINQLFFIKGVSLTTSIHSSLLSLCTPIFITIIAAWLIKEALTWLKFIGLALGIGGALLLILLKDNNHTGSNVILGDVFVMINAISYAFYLVMVRPLMASYSAMHVLRWVFTIGGLIMLPISAPEFFSTNWHAFDIPQWTALGFVAIGATFFAYLFNVFGISKIGPSATGTYIYTQPVFAAIIAMIYAGEHFSWIKGLAAILIFSGVYLANFKKELA